MAVVALSLPLTLTLGLACSQVAESEAPQLEGPELAAALADEGIFLLDVREPSELEELGTVEGYVNIPIDQLADRLDELPRDKRILTA
jgi:predicted sulfurtransferase